MTMGKGRCVSVSCGKSHHRGPPLVSRPPASESSCLVTVRSHSRSQARRRERLRNYYILSPQLRPGVGSVSTEGVCVLERGWVGLVPAAGVAA